MYSLSKNINAFALFFSIVMNVLVIYLITNNNINNIFYLFNGIVGYLICMYFISKINFEKELFIKFSLIAAGIIIPVVTMGQYFLMNLI